MEVLVEGSRSFQITTTKFYKLILVFQGGYNAGFSGPTSTGITYTRVSYCDYSNWGALIDYATNVPSGTYINCSPSTSPACGGGIIGIN